MPVPGRPGARPAYAAHSPPTLFRSSRCDSAESLLCGARLGALLNDPKPPRDDAPSCLGARGGGLAERCDEKPPLNDFDDEDDDWRGSALATGLMLSRDNTSTAWRACIKDFIVRVAVSK